MAEPSGVRRFSGVPSSRETTCTRPGAVADDQRAADRAAARSACGTCSCSVLPGALAVGAAPGHDVAVVLGAVDEAVVAAHAVGAGGGLAPEQRAARGVHAADAGVVGARADGVADRGSRCRSGRPGARRRWCRAVRRSATSQRDVPLAGLMPTSRPPTPVTSVSPTAISTPGLLQHQVLARCAAASRGGGRSGRPRRWCCGRRPARRRGGRPPAARCSDCAVSRCVHSTLPPCMATRSLLRGDDRDQRCRRCPRRPPAARRHWRATIPGPSGASIMTTVPSAGGHRHHVAADIGRQREAHPPECARSRPAERRAAPGWPAVRRAWASGCPNRPRARRPRPRPKQRAGS